MTLPKESVEVLKGVPSSAQESSIQTLKQGGKVRLEFMPGKKAWVYIL